MTEKAPNANAAMVRNIIVGVSTSVLGAAALYFLGINKSGGSAAATQGSYAEVKEATTKGWKSYVTDDNIYYKNTISINNDLQRNQQWDDYRDNMLKEMHKFQDDVESILKDETMDNSFKTMLKRRLDGEKESEPKFRDLVSNLKSIMNSSASQTEKQQKLMQESQKWTNTTKGILERSITEVEDLSKALNEKYGPSFNLTDFLAYQAYKKGPTGPEKNGTNAANNNMPVNPSNNDDVGNNSVKNTTGNKQMNAGMFGGTWAHEAGTVYFDSNGFSWQWNDGKQTSTGSWNANYNKLYLYITGGYSAGYTSEFNISNLTENSFTIQLTTNAAWTFHLVKQ